MNAAVKPRVCKKQRVGIRYDVILPFDPFLNEWGEAEDFINILESESGKE